MEGDIQYERLVEIKSVLGELYFWRFDTSVKWMRLNPKAMKYYVWCDVVTKLANSQHVPSHHHFSYRSKSNVVKERFPPLLS